ncbi:MAG: response regulator [Chloroflexota bacterium]|nr:response regulator [Chloroflexota bacterium]
MPDSRSEKKHSEHKAILFVEHDLVLGEFLVMATSQETPYQPLLAQTKEQALEMVQHITPDLFVLDFVPGTMNGFDLYDSLHAQPGFEAIPALFLSANLPELQKEMDQRQVIGLAKPFGLDELLLSFHRMIGV